MKTPYWIKRLFWMKAFFSPFIHPKLKLYVGKIAYGTPYFYPRKWIKNRDKRGYLTATPKKIGFDFVSLGWKTKWTDTDYRFEWGPMWSFVFFKWQICLFFVVPYLDHYWTSWLYYELSTDKTKTPQERIKQCKKEFPQIWTQYSNGKKTEIDYYPLILKK